MRYWAYFAAKLVTVAATFYGLLVLLNWYWPLEPPSRFSYVPPRFGYNLGYTLMQLGSCSDALTYLERSRQIQPQRREVKDAIKQARSC